MLYRVMTETAPSGLPVSVAELQLHARTLFPGEPDVFDGAEDSLLQLYIEAATNELDFPSGYLGRSLLPRTIRVLIDSTPNHTILLPGPPVTEISEVKYYDDDGIEQEILPADYLTDLNDTGWPARIWPVDDAWPSMEDRPGRMWIDYISGYSTAADIPAVIRHALLVMAATKYRDRESGVVATIIAEHEHIKRALDNWRVHCAWEISG